MQAIQAFIFGFLAAAIGTLPPGLLNMTASKIGVQDGKIRAMLFGIGAAVIVMCQAYISVAFAKVIDGNEDILILLREVGLVIFSVLTFYFFWTSKEFTPKNEAFKIKSKKGSFFQGLMLSALNFFPIPYYVFISLSFAGHDLFLFETYFEIWFVVGTGFGAVMVFYSYIEFFKKMQKKSNFVFQNMNYIIGSITAVVALSSLIKVIQYYCK